MSESAGVRNGPHNRLRKRGSRCLNFTCGGQSGRTRAYYFPRTQAPLRLLRRSCKSSRSIRHTVTKIRSILSGVFSFAISEGHFPARSAADNPASRARIPESATEPKRTVAATREEVQAILTALKQMPLERAAVAITAFTGVRPGEARGLRWEEWDRAKQHIA